LSLRLLIDEDTQDRLLVKFLRYAGHNVLTANQAGLSGQSDEQVLSYAIAHQRILLTLNCQDFEELHASIPEHSGIFAIYRDANRSKNMSFKAIVRVIANLEAAKVPLANQFISLNQWNY
jgi:predicted nuclease of predicted toxin-antitoxin system